MTNKSIVLIILLTFTALLLSTFNSAQDRPFDYYQPTERETYYLNQLVDHSNGVLLTGIWSQKGSVWIEVEPSWKRKWDESRDLAESSAKYLRKAVGYMVCVHLYYGDFHEITGKCK